MNALRTAAGELRVPWRIAIFGAAIFACTFAFLAIGLGVVSATPVASLARAARIPVDQWFTAISLVMATWMTGRLAHEDGFAVWRYVDGGEASWKVGRIGVASLAGVLVIAIPSLLLVTIGAARFESSVAADSGFVIGWAALVLLLPAALSEELIFRGYLFSACRDGIGPRGAVVVTSVLFGLAHLLNPDPSVASVAAVVVAGAFLAVVRIATGSLAAAVGAHFWINFTQTAILHAPVSGLAFQMPGYRFVNTGPDWATGGSWGPEAGAGAVLAFAVASFLYLRRGGSARNSTPAATP